MDKYPKRKKIENGPWRPLRILSVLCVTKIRAKEERKERREDAKNAKRHHFMSAKRKFVVISELHFS